MVGDNNKILTVSYGTFSCTLEGFDDPFSMMKAIAEYFRDLTAGDRFFGAEPPQPDTEALQKIAKQTANTSVDVEVSENAMILRNASGDGYETVGAPGAVGAVAAALTSGVADTVAAAPLTTPSPTTPSDFGKGDTIAEKLQRIRAAVSRDVAKPEDVAAFFSEDQHAEEDASDDMQAEDQVAADSDADAEVISESAFVSDATSTELASDEASATMTDEQDAASEDSIAEDDIDQAERTETNVAEADEADAKDTAEADDASSDEALQKDVAAAETADEVETVSEDDTTAEDSKLSKDDEDVSQDISEDVAEADVAADEDDIDGEAKPRRRIIVQKISRADVEAAQPGASQNGTLPESDAAELSPEAEAALMAELESVEAEMDTSDAVPVTSEAITPAETPSEEAEALAGATPKRAVITSKLRPGETEEQRQARLERRALMVEDEDAALNRLMDATSSRLSDDDEGAVRRASIAHLKAAVAATKADDSIAQAAAVEEERELDQYRSDLARVVRPSKSKPNNRDGDAARSRPLMLVSEQRIEEPADEPAAVAARDIRSRPITAGNLALQQQVEDELNTDAVAGTEVEDFEGFAARFGALELPDLLEAAAAHFTFVEGTTSFTRPMLMRKISSTTSAQNISREAGLRSFGALLREGKLIKGDDGKFVISANSRFAP